MKILLTIACTIMPRVIFACSVCGGSANSQNLGILPQFNKHFVGLQYVFKSYSSVEETNHGSKIRSTDQYQSLQLWGRYTLSNRVQLFAFIPYSYNRSNHEGVPVVISGIGDASILANYRLIRADNCNPVWKQNLQLGGGIKLPTGSYVPSAGNEGLPNMQPGTGSLDLIANINYSLQYRKTGFNIDASYTLNTPNRVSYKFGDRITLGMLAYHVITAKKYSLLPLAGIKIERYSADFDSYQKRWRNDMTGGEILYGTIGFQAFYNRIGLNVNGALPLKQSYPDNSVSAGYKIETGIQFLF